MLFASCFSLSRLVFSSFSSSIVALPRLKISEMREISEQRHFSKVTDRSICAQISSSFSLLNVVDAKKTACAKSEGKSKSKGHGLLQVIAITLGKEANRDDSFLVAGMDKVDPFASGGTCLSPYNIAI